MNDTNRKELDLPLLLYQVSEALDTLEGSLLPGGDPHNVEVGAFLLKIRDRLDGLHEKIKAELRIAALKETGGEPGTAEFHGTDQGHARVTVTNNRISLPTGTNLDDLVHNLQKIVGVADADQLVDRLFMTRVTVKPRALDFLSTLPDRLDDAKTYLMGKFKLSGSTPRVSFNFKARVTDDDG